jgi:hypothetical protein
MLSALRSSKDRLSSALSRPPMALLKYVITEASSATRRPSCSLRFHRAQSHCMSICYRLERSFAPRFKSQMTAGISAISSISHTVLVCRASRRVVASLVDSLAASNCLYCRSSKSIRRVLVVMMHLCARACIIIYSCRCLRHIAAHCACEFPSYSYSLESVFVCLSLAT